VPAKVSAQAVVYSFHKRLKDHVPGLCSERDANRELAGGVVASLKAPNKPRTLSMSAVVPEAPKAPGLLDQC
jgi:hypothetical protein